MKQSICDGAVFLTAAVLPLFCFCLGDLLWAAEVPLKDQPHLRRPIAGAWLVESKRLAVANQRSGSLSIVDIEKRKVLAACATTCNHSGIVPHPL